MPKAQAGLLFPASTYVNYDPFDQERDMDIRLRAVKLVTTRKPHQCVMNNPPHTIPAGTPARYEQALIDGDYWGRYWACVPCMDKWLAEIGVRQ